MFAFATYFSLIFKYLCRPVEMHVINKMTYYSVQKQLFNYVNANLSIILNMLSVQCLRFKSILNIQSSYYFFLQYEIYFNRIETSTIQLSLNDLIKSTLSFNFDNIFGPVQGYGEAIASHDPCTSKHPIEMTFVRLELELRP